MTDAPRDERIVAEIHAPINAGVEPDGDRWALVMRRSFTHSPERLWRMLTEPELLARWSPVVPDRPLTSEGPASSRENPDDAPVDAEVLTAEAPRLLMHRWGGDVLRWIIEPHGSGSVLEMRQTFDDRASAPMYAAGWRVCIGRLAAEGDGAQRERVVGMRAMDYGWQELSDRYAIELG